MVGAQQVDVGENKQISDRMKPLLKAFLSPKPSPNWSCVLSSNSSSEVCDDSPVPLLHQFHTLSCPNAQFSKSDFPSFIQSKGSLEITESQSADAEPPPPPKPDLSRYTGLRTHLSLATNEGKGRSRSENVIC